MDYVPVLKLKETARTMLLELKVSNAFDTCGKDADACGLTKEDLSQLIGGHHHEFAFCDEAELPDYCCRAWEEAQPGGSAAALMRRGDVLQYEDFSAWYQSFLAFLECAKARPTARPADVCADGPFASDDTWGVPMERLQDALDAAWAKRRTPLLIDMTADGGRGDSTPLEVYFSYSGDKIIDWKRLVVEVPDQLLSLPERTLASTFAASTFAVRWR